MPAPSGAQVHPQAVVDPAARLGEGVVVGPWCLVGPDVEIGAGTVLEHSTTVVGHTRIGRNNRIGPFVAIGMTPQHLGYKGEPTRTEIGDGNTLREFVTIHRGTPIGGGVTHIGDACYLMNYSHVGHDCHVGNNVILANSCNLGGHVMVRDRANLGGVVAVHQFVQIGEYAMVGGASAIRHDVPPYCMVEGNPARLRGLNLIGLKRNQFAAETVSLIKKCYKISFRSQLVLEKSLEALAGLDPDPVVTRWIEFMSTSRRGVQR